MKLGGLPIVMAGAACLVLAAPASSGRLDSVWNDKTGDAPGGAPDISVVTLSNVQNRITFRVAVANQPTLNPDSEILLLIDSDNKPSTGRPNSLGADYRYDLYVEGGELYYEFDHWNGAEWVEAPSKTVDGFYDRGLTLEIDRSELGNTTALNFWARGLQNVGDDFVADDAPDDGIYSYKLQGSTVTIAHVAMVPHGYPPRAGKTITVTVPYVELSTGKKVKPQSYSCKAKVASTALAGRGAGHCTFRMPASSRGKRLTVFATARYAGSVATNQFSVVVS